VSYAVPTPTWKAAYRVVLDDGSAHGLLQAWALINNATQEDWHGVQLTLATGAPMSFATDLHTPQYVKRPDANGHLIAPTVLGPIGGETVNGVADRDADGIPDADDKCPDETSTDDMDGCPSRSRVVMTSTSLQILERIQFAFGSEALAPTTRPLLDAIAETLKRNPDITRLEVEGFASEDEREPWGLSSRRAAAVRAALVERGVAADRLVIQPFAATMPLDPGDSEAARAKNRRVDFMVVKLEEDDDVWGSDSEAPPSVLG